MKISWKSVQQRFKKCKKAIEYLDMVQEVIGIAFFFILGINTSSLLGIIDKILGYVVIGFEVIKHTVIFSKRLVDKKAETEKTVSNNQVLSEKTTFSPQRTPVNFSTNNKNNLKSRHTYPKEKNTLTRFRRFKKWVENADGIITGILFVGTIICLFLPVPPVIPLVLAIVGTIMGVTKQLTVITEKFLKYKKRQAQQQVTKNAISPCLLYEKISPQPTIKQNLSSTKCKFNIGNIHCGFFSRLFRSQKQQPSIQQHHKKFLPTHVM